MFRLLRRLISDRERGRERKVVRIRRNLSVFTVVCIYITRDDEYELVTGGKKRRKKER